MPGNTCFDLLDRLSDSQSEFHPPESLPGTNLSGEDTRTNVTTPEPDEDDEGKVFGSYESDEEEDTLDNDDGDEASIASYDSNFPDEYMIHDHEARDIQPEKLQIGPSSLNFPATSSALTAQSKEIYLNLPTSVKLRIAALILLPEDQTVRVIWNHDARVWIYAGSEIPFVQFGFQGMKSVAKEFLDRAPLLYTRDYNLLVHYRTAELSFEYNRCGGRDEDDEKYLFAMEDAGDIVKRQNRDPSKPKIRNLALSWCPRHDSPNAILKYFRHIKGLKKVDLMTHGHYKRGTGHDSNLRNVEEENDRYHVANSLGWYKFKVNMHNHWGMLLEEDEGKSQSEGEF